MTTKTKLCTALASLILVACATPNPAPPAKSHLGADDVPVTRGTIPPPVQQSLALPKPKPAAKTETYSVVVNNVKVQELLFALARDAKLNVDVHPGITGTVTLNAIEQTLPQLLNRIAKQADVRWELDGPNLSVMPDSPFLRIYKIDYVNMNRDTSSSMAVTSQIASGAGSSSGGSGGSGGGGGGSGSNNSNTTIKNEAKNHFWDTLTQNVKDILRETDKVLPEVAQNVKDILRETDKVLPEGSSDTVTEHVSQQQTTGTGTVVTAATRALQAATNLAGSPNPASLQSTGATVTRRATFREAASVIANPETGVMTVRATSRQHEKLQEFLDLVLASARRQVLIEATIAEVRLSQGYQQGIDWSRFRGNSQGTGFSFTQTGGTVVSQAGLALTTNPSPSIATGLLAVGARHLNTGGAIFASALRLLETFGTVKVLSSPKISVLNNQSAVLKVVDNRVYFTVKTETNQNANNTTTNVTATAYTVPVGFIMNVTPQISETDTILLNLRPSISRVLNTVPDPTPGIINSIPEIRTREMESVLRVENGNIAVMGGLMEDTLSNQDNGTPGLSRLPGIGSLFTQRSDSNEKTELVIFLRPIIIREASIAGDFRELRDLLPKDDFFLNNPGPTEQVAPSTPLGSRP